MTVQIVGPLETQNNLHEIATNGASAQSAARTNLGIGSVAGPYLPLAGGTLTGPLVGTTYNGLTITVTVGGVLTVASAKTVTFGNTLGFTGTDGTSFAFPATSDTVAALGTAETFTAPQTFSSGIVIPKTFYYAPAYGGTWDGVASVSTPLQAALTAAGAAGGGTVVLPAGVIPLLTPVVAPSNVTLVGEGTGTIIKPTAGNVSSVLLFAPDNSSTGVRVRDLVFDGGGQSSAQTAPMLQQFHVTDVIYENVTFQNCGGMATNFSTSNNIKFVNCRFLHCGNRWKTTLSGADRHEAISLNSGDGVTWGFDNSIVNCYFEDIGLDPISVGFGTRLTVSDNRMNLENNQRALITLADYPGCNFITCNYVAFTGNVITGAQGNAFDSQGVKNASISNNVISEGGGAGIGLFIRGPITTTSSLSAGVLTVTVTSGVIVIGMTVSSITGAAIDEGTYILSQLTGSTGSTGTYSVTGTQSVGSQSMVLGRCPRNVTVSGNSITNCSKWASSPWTGGITIGDGLADGVTITGNVCTDTQATKTQLYGFAVITSATWTARPFNLTVEGNNFAGNATAPILDPSLSVNRNIRSNIGVDNILGTIASGATLTLPFNSVISLTGSATATVIAAPACWTGRQGKFIPNGAAVFTAGGTIGNTVTCVANVPLGFTFDGTKLYLG